jgi:hypothetical protein
MDLSESPVRRPEIAWRVIDDEAVIVDPKSSVVYPLNPAATRIWQLAEGKYSIDEIIDLLLDEFEAGREELEKDVIRFCIELSEKKLITVNPLSRNPCILKPEDEC